MSAGGAALIVMQASPNLSQAVSYALLLRQLIKATEAIADAHRAAGDAQRAAELETFARTRLEVVHKGIQAASGALPVVLTDRPQTALMPDAEEAIRQAGTDFPRTPTERVTGTPLPAKLGPRREVGQAAGQTADQRTDRDR